MAFHFIVNPKSGRGRVAARIAAVVAGLEAAGRRAVMHRTGHAGHATRIAAGVGDDAEAVVAVGGDGTVREVAVGLIGRPVPLAILPAGTENLIARELGIPGCPRRLSGALLQRRTARVDVALANDRPFLVIAGVGFDAEVVRRVTGRRRGHITQLNYFWPIWRTFWTHRYRRLEVRADGELLFEGSGLVFVGNMPRYATNLRICARADWSDGLLDLCVLPAADSMDLLSHAFMVAARRHLSHGRVVYRQAASIWVGARDAVPVQCDGDDAGWLPVKFSILPAGVHVVLPAGSPPAEARSGDQ